MKKTVERYISTCEKCQRNKTRQTKPPGTLHSLSIPDARWRKITMDYITKLPSSSGHDAIWVIVDRLTKRLHLIPCTESMTAEEAAGIFKKSYQRFHGLPDEITSDRDKIFKSKFWVTLMELQNTKVSLTTAYRKSGDGQSEICNRFIEDYIRNYLSPKEQNWDSHLEEAEFAFNSRFHSSIQMTPFEADLGYNPRSPSDIIFEQLSMAGNKKQEALSFAESSKVQLTLAQDAITQAQLRMKHYYDRNRPEQKFEKGDKVMLITTNLSTTHIGQGVEGKRKFGPKWIGPFDIIESIRRDTYKLQLPPAVRLHPYFHTAMLKPYNKDKNTRRRNVPAEEVLLADGSVGRIIEKLVRYRKPKNSEREFLVRWQGCNHQEDLWYPESSLKQVQGLIDEALARIQPNKRRKR